MSDLKNRIEEIEEAILPERCETVELFVQRMHAAANNIGRWALQEVEWASRTSKDLVQQKLELLDRFGLAERLLGTEIAARLRAGELGKPTMPLREWAESIWDLSQWIASNCEDVQFKRAIAMRELASSVWNARVQERAAFRRWVLARVEDDADAREEALWLSWNRFEEHDWATVRNGIAEPQPSDTDLLRAMARHWQQQSTASSSEGLLSLVRSAWGEDPSFGWLLRAAAA